MPKDHYNIYKSITRFSYFYYDDLRKANGNLDEKRIAKLKNEGKFQLFDSVKEFIESDIQVYKNQKDNEGKIAGIPQGLPISAMLANLYMLPFDQLVVRFLVQNRGCFYRRYSDDLVIICDNNMIEEVNNFVMQSIEQIDLIIEPNKTEKFQFSTDDQELKCFKINEGELIPNSYLLYLGFQFYGNKTLLKTANISEFYREMKESIKMKRKRIDTVKKKYLIDDEVLYKRKLYRLFSFRGSTKYPRYLPGTRTFHNGRKIVSKPIKRRYRGNFIKYAYRASDIMNAPEIRRQVRRHNVILKNYLNQKSLT